MARICRIADSDDELPELSEILRQHAKIKPGAGKPASTPPHNPSPTKTTTSCDTPSNNRPRESSEGTPESLPPHARSTRLVRSPSVSAGRQRRLSPLKRDCTGVSTRLPVFGHVDTSTRQHNLPAGAGRARSRGIATPASTEQIAANIKIHEDSQSEVEESIWCGSETDQSESDINLSDPVARWSSPRKRQVRKILRDSDSSDSEPVRRPGRVPKTPGKPPLEDRCSSETKERTLQTTNKGRSEASSDKENNDFAATLRFSPPKLQSRAPESNADRPCTPPPQSPSKSRLASPSKTRFRIPTPPHRPSIDAFWNASNINDWNDQYSPQKPLLSPKKTLFPRLPSDSTSPSASPGKAPTSPSKRTRAEIEAKKAFDNTKHALAVSFLAELDTHITAGQIAALALSGGGVQIQWSKTLNSTAGRATWKRETIRTPSSAPHSGSSTTRPATTMIVHRATIELAEKVIDSSPRLLNVLAHEFCHLATFMISGVTNNPHGAQFKQWGAACGRVFGGRGVNVTTKHSYAIDYKYIWRCGGCGVEYKRHSRSVDTEKQRCGACKGRLVQVKPVPRGGGGGGRGRGMEGGGGGAMAVKGEKVVTGYAGFVKEWFAVVKKEAGKEASHKEVMEMLGKRYREQKARAEVETAATAAEVEHVLDDVTDALGLIVLDD